MDVLTVAQSVRDIFIYLNENPLVPSPELDDQFRKLISISTKEICPTQATYILDELADMLPTFRLLQSQAEYLLELEWASRIVVNKTPLEAIKSFPYWNGYQLLIHAEIRALSAHSRRAMKDIAIIGSGPFPLTAIILATEFGISSLCIDRDSIAITRGRQLIQHLGLSNLIEFRLTNAMQIDTIQGIDAVILAALAGDSLHEKGSIIDVLHSLLEKDVLLCARTVEGLAALHYIPVHAADIQPFSLIVEARAKKPAINFSLIACAQFNES